MSELTPEPDSTGGKSKKKMEMLTTELVYSHIKLIISCVMQGNSRRSSQKLNFTSTIYKENQALIRGKSTSTYNTTSTYHKRKSSAHTTYILNILLIHIQKLVC
jgi:hypothetical protein